MKQTEIIDNKKIKNMIKYRLVRNIPIVCSICGMRIVSFNAEKIEYVENTGFFHRQCYAKTYLKRGV